MFLVSAFTYPERTRLPFCQTSGVIPQDFRPKNGVRISSPFSLAPKTRNLDDLSTARPPSCGIAGAPAEDLTVVFVVVHCLPLFHCWRELQEVTQTGSLRLGAFPFVLPRASGLSCSVSPARLRGSLVSLRNSPKSRVPAGLPSWAFWSPVGTDICRPSPIGVFFFNKNRCGTSENRQKLAYLY